MGKLSGTASYVGETVAIQQPNTVLTGTARVDVIWTIDDADKMTLTIGELADSTGDPLTYNGVGNKIADIVFRNIVINEGRVGPNAGHLIAGDENSMRDADDNQFYTYDEFTMMVDTGVRYRLTAAGEDEKTPTSGSTAGVKALFVGQGVGGPLGVIGTWTLEDSAVSRVHADGTKVEAGQGVIRGAFGADLP